MSNKLQELTERLYNEGLSKGKEEGEKVLSEARAKAAEIIAEAEKQAANLITGAEKDAASLRHKVESDLKAGAEQCMQATKKDIENLLVGRIVDVSPLEDEGFLKEMISAVAQKFSTDEGDAPELVLPEKLKSGLEPWVASELTRILGKETDATFSKKINGGFTIGPKDGSYFISLTDETFRELIASYIRPVTKKLIFGE